METLQKIASVLGVGVQDLLIPSGMIGFHEDVEPFNYNFNDNVLPKLPINQSAFTVLSNCLNELGILPGHILIADIEKEAVESVKTGDIVVAQHYDETRFDRATTILRVFLAPNLLVTNSSTENTLPLNMRTSDVHIKGVVRRTIVSKRL